MLFLMNNYWNLRLHKIICEDISNSDCNSPFLTVNGGIAYFIWMLISCVMSIPHVLIKIVYNFSRPAIMIPLVIATLAFNLDFLSTDKGKILLIVLPIGMYCLYKLSGNLKKADKWPNMKYPFRKSSSK